MRIATAASAYNSDNGKVTLKFMERFQHRIARARSRLTILQYVSLHLVIGLVVSAICLWVFAKLAREVLSEQEFTLIDNSIAADLHLYATPLATQVFLILSAFGFQILYLVALVVGLYFILKRAWLRLSLWIAALVGGQVLNLLLKDWFARPRPVFSDPLAVALFYSFPSGHATMSLIAYGLIAYFLWTSAAPRFPRRLATVALTLLILLIGLSRLYLGVHYFSDVIAGFAAGGLWLSFCITAADFIRRRHENRQPTP